MSPKDSAKQTPKTRLGPDPLRFKIECDIGDAMMRIA